MKIAVVVTPHECYGCKITNPASFQVAYAIISKVRAQATPLNAFLSGTGVGFTPHQLRTHTVPD